MKRLIFRLSSLGDVILSQAVLEPRFDGETHWVVAQEFEALLKGNPAIHRLWTYDRRQNPGIRAWFSFLKILSQENFTSVLDVHSTLRTQLARIYFLFASPRTQWKKISKERLRRFGYVTLKRFWPKIFRPRHLSEKAAQLAGGNGSERPNLRWMITEAERNLEFTEAERNLEFTEAERNTNSDDLNTQQREASSNLIHSILRGPKHNFIALVPSSAWRGKEWPVSAYLSWLKMNGCYRADAKVILLGTSKDVAATTLRDGLIRENISFVDAVGKFSLLEVARILRSSLVTVGSDTGLLHLSEAIGTPVVTIFGPTRSDFGFGPSDSRSISLNSPLWCSPCSKDGSLCFRIKNRYKCMDQILPVNVEGSVQKISKNHSVQNTDKSASSIVRPGE